MMPRLKRGTWREHGHAIIEVTLMAPWIFFLFVGTLDFGFYSYAIIATQNAARIAVMRTSQTPTTSTDTTLPSNYPLPHLNFLPITPTLPTSHPLPSLA